MEPKIFVSTQNARFLSQKKYDLQKKFSISNKIANPTNFFGNSSIHSNTKFT
ncbi:MAG: hypothetical protein HPY66_1152 [Firmicutes bacterium]|nr:hypothetical protein [Bacillota bacterium]